MVLLRTCIPNRGFTLFELVVVIALASVIASLGLIVSMSDFRAYRYRDERDVIIAALMHARSESLARICNGSGCTEARPHGVYFGTPHEYIVFEGDAYATRDASDDEIIPARDATAVVSGMEFAVFSAGSGEVYSVPVATLTLETGTASTTVSIDPDGRISY